MLLGSLYNGHHLKVRHHNSDIQVIFRNMNDIIARFRDVLFVLVHYI